MIDDYYKDYKRFCLRCGWNDPDYGCLSPPGEEVYQCPMYIYYHPEEVEEFNRSFDNWMKSKEKNN